MPTYFEEYELCFNVLHCRQVKFGPLGFRLHRPVGHLYLRKLESAYYNYDLCN